MIKVKAFYVNKLSMYIHNLRDSLQEYERQRQEDETLLSVFGLPLAILAILLAGVVWLFVPTSASAVGLIS